MQLRLEPMVTNEETVPILIFFREIAECTFSLLNISVLFTSFVGSLFFLLGVTNEESKGENAPYSLAKLR